MFENRASPPPLSSFSGRFKFHESYFNNFDSLSFAAMVDKSEMKTFESRIYHEHQIKSVKRHFIILILPGLCVCVGGGGGGQD